MNHSDGFGATLTRLGRAVRTAGGPARTVEPQHREQLIDARVDLGATDTAQLETVTDVLRDRHMRP